MKDTDTTSPQESQIEKYLNSIQIVDAKCMHASLNQVIKSNENLNKEEQY
jgi:hypothetical protein